MTQRDGLLITEPEQITAEWLSEVLGQPVADIEVSPVGTGQIGAVHRVRPLSGPAPSVLVKLPAADPAARELLAGVYRTEVRFYREVAATVSVQVPEVYLAESSHAGTQFTLVMVDLAPAAQGDQLAGCTAPQAIAAVVNLAGLHGPRWCDPSLLDIEGLTPNGPDDAAMMAEFFAPSVDEFLKRVGNRLAPGTELVLRQTAQVIGDWALARAQRFAPIHGDYRLDNLLFAPPATPERAPVTAVDWQTLSLGLPARDLAYFAGTSLLPAQRRQLDEPLVRAWWERLVALGVTDYSLDLAWEDYRFALLQGPLVAVFGCAYGTRTDRGDAMFAAMVDRSAQAITDLDTFSLV